MAQPPNQTRPSWLPSFQKIRRSKVSAWVDQKPDDPVVEVTADTFHRIVMDARRDVLIEFYTTQVPPKLLYSANMQSKAHQTIQETYNNLGNIYVNDDRIIIARCNVDKENIPIEVYHIPTIKLFPAMKKNAPVEYFSKLTDLEDYRQFIGEERETDSKNKC